MAQQVRRCLCTHHADWKRRRSPLRKPPRHHQGANKSERAPRSSRRSVKRREAHTHRRAGEFPLRLDSM